MLVREIMTAPAVAVHENDSIDQVIEVLAERHITNLPVVGDGHYLRGVVSEVDVLRHMVPADARARLTKVAADRPLPKTVGEIMSADPTSATENTDVADLVQVFMEERYKSLPVLRSGVLVGIVSRSDILRALWRADEELNTELQELFSALGMETYGIAVDHAVVTINGPRNVREASAAEALAHSVLGVRRVSVA